MKDLSMLIWLTQLGLSVAIPLAGFVLLAVWLQQTYSFGIWVIIVGVVLGIVCAVSGLRSSLKAMEQMSKTNEKKDIPPLSFNEHD